MRLAWTILLFATSGCVTNPLGPVDKEAGSETHWLGLCDASTACPDGSDCVCGICTALCPDDASCNREGFSGRCASPADVASLCGRPIAPAVCVSECLGDADCDGGRCADGICIPQEPTNERRGGLRSESYQNPEQRKVDFLFMVDNSGSMCEEQAALVDAFGEISADIIDVDYRIAVITTDMARPDAGRFLAEPAPPVPALNCLDPETNDPLTPNTADCPPDLPSVLSPANETDLALQFRCLATLGTSGDGFEKGLESMRVALSCEGPNVDELGDCCVDGQRVATCTPNFLRPDAELMVVFITDEDDCSDPATNPPRSQRVICKYGAVDGDQDGIPDGYQDPVLCTTAPAECFRQECPDGDAQACATNSCEVSRSENSNCEWDRNLLVPVTEYADFLKTLKADPQDIAIAAYVGERAYTESGDEIFYNGGVPEPRACDPDDATFDPSLPLDTCCPSGQCVGRIEPSCESDFGIAFAGRRYLDLADQFAARCRPEDGCGICGGGIDLVQPSLLFGSFCLLKAPLCAVSSAGGSRSCATVEEREASANHQVEVAISCATDGPDCGPLERVLAPSEYALDPLDACPGGWIVRPGEELPQGAKIRITYLPAP